MKILITGGAGFIGSHLGLYLMQQKHQVLFLDNLSFGYLENLKSPYYAKRLKNQKIDFVQADICDPNIGNYLAGVDIVFHLAGISSLPECQNNPYQAYQVNVAGTANILEAARRHNVRRVVFSSSSAVYENVTSFPLLEDAPVSPTLIYSVSKKHAEEVCHSYQKLYGMDIVILRFFNVYGPHMDFRRPNPPVASYIIKCLLKNENPILHSDGNQARDMIYIDDVLKFCEIILIHKNAKNQIFNVGSGKAYTLKKIYDQIEKVFTLKKIEPTYQSENSLWESYPQLFKGDYPFKIEFLKKEVNKYTLASIAKAKKILDWTPQISLRDGLKNTVMFVMKMTDALK